MRKVTWSVGAIVVYDVSNHDTFLKMEQWVKELKQYLSSEIPIIIAGNKADTGNFVVD